MTVTETLGGIKTDYKYIIKYLEDLVREYNLKPQLICYDPHNASAFLSDLEAMGFDSISVTQTAKELNDATVDFRLEILAGNVEIEGMEVGKEGNKIVVPVDSLLVWSIANAKRPRKSSGAVVWLMPKAQTAITADYKIPPHPVPYLGLLGRMGLDLHHVPLPHPWALCGLC